MADTKTKADDTKASTIESGLAKWYFSPLLPWQTHAWEQMTAQYYAHKLPHGLLAQGMAGIGKHEFVGRFVAWLLCEQKTGGHTGACGECQSCLWLKAGTHPDLKYLPSDDGAIKIDDVRALQDFFASKSIHARVVVLDGADAMTLGASNALLKTLEEPTGGLHFVLISDNVGKLLPTIKSRVQSLPLLPMDKALASRYVAEHCADGQADMLLELADFAPLRAVALPNEAWFVHRATWLKTFVALQLGQRTPVQASDYWQGVLPLSEFLLLSRMMVAEIWRVLMGMASLHSDIAVVDYVAKLQTQSKLDENKLTSLLHLFDEMSLSLGQNVQEKMAYDKLMTCFADS